ncbi:MAG: hypothetical protein HOZ81_23590 [Streptomyces sp.]|nr:hypothetical protein [Streptomyces sp.]
MAAVAAGQRGDSPQFRPMLERIRVARLGGGRPRTRPDRVLSPSPRLGVVGFGITGLGLATSLPVLFGLVGHFGADQADDADAGAATMISHFTTMTYAGIFLGPAVIGWVADLVGLTWTLSMLIPLLLAVSAGAGIAGRAPASRSHASR